jgi:ClpP class serine protease
VASQYRPLSEEGRATMQEQVDHTYSVFVSEVAKYRGVSVDVVLERMADGRVFQGRQAVDAGLVDGIVPLNLLAAKLATQQPARELS